MAVGDDASEFYPLVPDDGVDGKVRYGAREINRTRDYVAQVRNQVPQNKTEFQSRNGISIGTGAPSGGANGDIYLRIV